MSQLPRVYVIDEWFCREMQLQHGDTDRTFDGFRVAACSDLVSGSMEQDVWSELRGSVPADRTPLLIVIGHRGIFRGLTADCDEHRPEVRVPAAEKDLVSHLPAGMNVYVVGFNHVEDSAIYRDFTPASLRTPGVFTLLRNHVEDGGGPFGRISVVKHNLMRPFTFVRLHLQVQANESGSIDAQLATRIAAAMSEGKKCLGELQSLSPAGLQLPTTISEVDTLLETDVQQVTSSSSAFNAWLDRLNDALDRVRREAR